MAPVAVAAVAAAVVEEAPIADEDATEKDDDFLDSIGKWFSDFF